MDFFNKLGDSIQNVGKEASKKAKDLSGTVTLNSQIKETETQLERIYKLIGEKYYMAYREEAAASIKGIKGVPELWCGN